VFNYMEPSGKISATICDGWTLAAVMTNGQITPRLVEAEPKPTALLPDFDRTHCAIVRL
jgi:hypothetical protein